MTTLQSKDVVGEGVPVARRKETSQMSCAHLTDFRARGTWASPIIPAKIKSQDFLAFNLIYITYAFSQ